MRFCGNRRVSHVLNLLWGLVYALCGAIQFVAGIYFMLDLPIFQVMEDWLKGGPFQMWYLQKSASDSVHISSKMALKDTDLWWLTAF